MIRPDLSPVSPREQLEHHRLAADLAGVNVDEFVLPKHEHVIVNGLRLHYLDWGQAGPPVLFLHGGGQTARTWDLVCLALRQEFRCLALDQRGHGDSEWSYSFDYSPPHHAQDFVGLLDTLGIDKAVVVGMSMGCLNGLELAISHPQRVAAFVAVDAGPWVQIEGGQAIIDFMADADGAASLDELITRSLRFNPRRDPRLLAVSLRHNLRQLPEGQLTWKADRRRPYDLPTLSRWLDAVRARIEAISCPTLILRGSESDLFLDEHAERFAKAVPEGRWIRIEGAGHTIQGDAPRALIGAVREFLRTVDGD